MIILERRGEWLQTYQNTFLAKFYESGQTDWSIYPRPNNQTPIAGKGIELSQSRLILITSAGGYLKDDQIPFEAHNPLGDYSIRLWPTTTPFSALAYAHEHYDHTAVNTDPQVLVPLRHLEALVNNGEIGALATQVISFSGYMPDVTRVIDELIPSVIEAATAEQADAALLVPS